jgi:hypothetical protein
MNTPRLLLLLPFVLLVLHPACDARAQVDVQWVPMNEGLEPEMMCLEQLFRLIA